LATSPVWNGQGRAKAAVTKMIDRPQGGEEVPDGGFGTNVEVLAPGRHDVHAQFGGLAGDSGADAECTANHREPLTFKAFAHPRHI